MSTLFSLPLRRAIVRVKLFTNSQQTQNICIAFVQRRPNVSDVGPTLYKYYTNVLCLLGRAQCLLFENHPENVRRSPYVVVMLVQSPRRLSHITAALGMCLVFVGKTPTIQKVSEIFIINLRVGLPHQARYPPSHWPWSQVSDWSIFLSPSIIIQISWFNIC